MIIETHCHEFMNEEKQHMNTKFFLFLQNKRWFRRWNAGILAAMLLFSVILAVPAYAEEEKESFSQVGMDFVIPEEIRVSKGTVAPYQVGAIDEAHHTYAGLVLYFAAPQEDVMRCMTDPDVSEEELKKMSELQTVLNLFFATEESLEDALPEAESLAGGIQMDRESVTELGTAGQYTYYAMLSDSEAYLPGIDQEYADEYTVLREKLLEAQKAADFYEPEDPEKAMIGQKLKFTTTSPDGTIYTSKELFGVNEITMVNCWGIWCPNCLNEMEDLAKIHSRIQEKGCGILGMEWEQSNTDDVYEQGRSVMEEAGADYPNVLMPDELITQIQAYPTTFFVDREGTILSAPIVGARVDLYEPTLEKLLESVGSTGTDETETEAGSSDTQDADGSAAQIDDSMYQVRVTDGENPVEGVMIQFCDASTCSMAETDTEGVAKFDMPEGTDYEVHVLAVPDGYQDNEEVYHFESGARELKITLQKKA